jgi:protein-S-isoprenylcysteine O-methyltransferase Ste14
VDNVDECNLILVLCRGRLVYFGPPGEARAYFGVTRLSEVYDCLSDREPRDWSDSFAACSLYREFVQKRLESQPESEHPRPAVASAPLPLVAAPVREATPRASHPPLWHQFRILTTRYSELIWGDPRSLRLLLLQAPIVALFVLLGFAGKPYDRTTLAPRRLTPAEHDLLQKYQPEIERAEQTILGRIKPDHSPDAPGPVARMVDGILQMDGPVVPSEVIVDPRYTYMLLFLVVIIVLWFGCNNAAKEIVKEEAIYNRERAVNLGILPYLASKFLVLCFLSAVQVFLVMLVIYGTMEVMHTATGADVPPLRYRLDYPGQYMVLVLLAMTGVALGLLLSACVSSPDRANSLLPYVLIPQIILGGGILPVRDGILYLIAVVASPAYWGYRAIRRGATQLPNDLPYHMDYDDSVWIVCAMLGAQMAVLLALTAWFLKQKDVCRA